MDKQTLHIKLIDSALKGDQHAFHQLYKMHKHSLFMVCLRYGKDRSTAQDYLQETFISIFKNLTQFNSSKGAFESWAKRIAVNVCLMDIRKNTLYAVNINAAEMVESKDVSALSELSLKEMLQHIQQLPTGYRTIFNLYVIDGFSHKEIAEKLNVSVSTSKSQLMKARQILQKKIIVNRNIYQQDHG